MKTLLSVAALAAALMSGAANADTVRHPHRVGAGLMRQTSAPMPDPTSFQGFYGSTVPTDECQGRVFGFCPNR